MLHLHESIKLNETARLELNRYMNRAGQQVDKFT